MNRRFVQRVGVVQVQPPRKLLFREPNSLPGKVVILERPLLRINHDARSHGVESRVGLIGRAGQPKGTFTYFALPGLSTGYKSVLKSLDGYHAALDKVLKSDIHNLGDMLHVLDTAAARIEKKAEEYLGGKKHTRKTEVGKVLEEVKAERKMLASLFDQIGEGKELPGVGASKLIELARGGVPLDDMPSYTRFDDDTVKAMMTDGGSKLPLDKVAEYNRAGIKYGEAVLLEQAGLGVETGRLYRQYDMPIVPNTLIKNFDIGAVENRGFDTFGKGAMNDVYEGKFKTADGVISGILKPLKLPDHSKRNAVDDGNVLRMIGVNVFNPQIGLRNVATCDIAKKLGFDVVPHTEIGVFKDQNDVDRLGVVMTKGDGKPGVKCNLEQLSDGGYRREVTKLQLLDQIVGQGDRHGNNYAVSFKTGKAVVTGYDNDQCLGRLTQHPDEVAYNGGSYRGVKLPGVIDSEMANAIRNLSYDDLEASLKGLTPQEINAAKSRLFVIKEHIDMLQGQNRIIEPDQWASRFVDRHMTTENSYFARDYDLSQMDWG